MAIMMVIKRKELSDCNTEQNSVRNRDFKGGLYVCF